MNKIFHNKKSMDNKDKLEVQGELRLSNLNSNIKNSPTKISIISVNNSTSLDDKTKCLSILENFEKASPSNALSFLKKKRKEYEESDREKDNTGFLHGFSNQSTVTKIQREEKKIYFDEKITDFFKYKKNKKTYNSIKCRISDDEDSNNSSTKNLKAMHENQLANFFNFNGNSPIKECTKKKTLTKRLEKDIKDYFKEFKLSNKTLNTLKKGNIYVSEPDLMLPSSRPKISLDMSRLPITSSKRNEKNHKDIDSILKTLSMRDKYEGLLNRELILPPSYKILLLQTEFLDQGILDIKFHKISKVNFDSLDYYVREKEFRIGLNLEDFQKMLQISPSAYLYKYESKKNGSNFANRYDAIIDIPNDYQQRIKNNYSNFNISELHKLQSLETHKGIEAPPATDCILLRLKKFKEDLINFTRIQHDKFLKKRGIRFDAIKFCTWHSEFNLDDVEKIKPFQMAPKPAKKPSRI